MSWFNEATALLQRRKTERVATVEELAARQADGEAVAPEDIVATCEAADVSLEDYAKLVEHRERRKALLKTLTEEPAAQRAKADAQKVLDKIVAEFQAAQQANLAREPAARQAVELANRRLEQIGQARGQLAGTCKDPRITSRLAEIGPEIGALQEQANGLEHQKAGADREIARLGPIVSDHEARRNRRPPQQVEGQKLSPGRDRASSFTPGDYNPIEHEQTRVAVERIRAELPGIESAIAAIPGRIAALQAERTKLLTAAEKSPV
jgi:hypothetical protein